MTGQQVQHGFQGNLIDHSYNQSRGCLPEVVKVVKLCSHNEKNHLVFRLESGKQCTFVKKASGLLSLRLFFACSLPLIPTL